MTDAVAVAPADKITCQECGALVHAIQIHLRDDHPGITLEQYRAKFPDAPVLSKYAEQKVAERRAASSPSEIKATPAPLTVAEVKSAVIDENFRMKAAFHETFKLGNVAAAKNARGEPIMVTTLGAHPHKHLVPAEDEAYIFNIDLLKTAVMGLELKIPSYLWGHAGTGKTTMWEQTCHHLNMPAVRVQHTLNTEEAHVVGQTLANEKGTYFEPGLLPLAMRNGWVYLADEYDRATPGVLSVYQPVLEGKPLVIKEAPPEWRVVEPHPNFRFVATGNSNGSGDESGLYQSTMIQDASNYSRFGIVEQVGYMAPAQEKRILVAKAGVSKEDADKLVEFAGGIRKRYDAKDLTNPIGPRELLFAAIVGVRRANYRAGIKLAFSNKLPERSRIAVDEFAQRVFGGAA